MLELAAKAAGYRIRKTSSELITRNDGQCWVQWNPLKSNADALQLAVDLKLIIDCSKPYAGKTPKPHATWWDENMSREELTRCVIVRAAAEIGRELEMAEKHEALRLAEWAERFCRNVEDPKDFRWKAMADMATELRRLHAVKTDLLRSLRMAVLQNSNDMLMTDEEIRVCEYAINKATEDQS